MNISAKLKVSASKSATSPSYKTLQETYDIKDAKKPMETNEDKIFE